MERMQGASWCYRCAEAVGWWLWVQPASGGYRGAGGSVLVAMDAGERMQPASGGYRGAGGSVRWCSVGAAWERMQASWFY